jgi:hypothetical protein
MLSHLDPTLRALDPSYSADTVLPKSLLRVQLFGGGELNRLILDALRRGGKPMTNVEIAAAIVAVKGYGEEAMPALIRRVPANLSNMQRNGARIAKTGNRMTARVGPCDGNLGQRGC